MNSYNKGFGLIGLFITLMVVGLAGWGTYSSLLKTKGTNENLGEQGLSAINEAEKAKQLLEQGNINTPKINKNHVEF